MGRKAPSHFILGPFVCSFVSIATTAMLLGALGIDSYGDALFLGAMVGIGYIGATIANIAINTLFPHPYAYPLFTVPMFLVGSLMFTAILVALSQEKHPSSRMRPPFTPHGSLQT